MIKKLTQDQKDLFPFYIDKWKKIGLSTKPMNKKNTVEGIKLAYEVAGFKKPVIIFTKSPLANPLTRFYLNNLLKNKNFKGLGSASVRDSVRDSIRASVRDSVRDSVCDSVRESVWDSVWDSVRDLVCDSVRDSVWDSVWDSVPGLDRYSVQASVRNSLYGQHEASWLAFYNYFEEVLNLKRETEKLKGLYLLAQNCGWVLPYRDFCFVSEKHNVCKLKNDKIHSEDGPAIAYPDGFEIYALNGVRVPKELVTTSGHLLDSKKWIAEKNVEIRREFVRKAGNEKICKDLNAKSLNVRDDYEVLELDLGDIIKAKYLKMKNPSIGVYHIECVSPECDTVEKALNFRNRSKEKPLILT